MQLPINIRVMSNFQQFVNRSSLDSSMKKHLTATQICKVKIGRKTKTWHIFIKCKDVIPYTGFRELSEEIKNFIPNLEHIFFIPCFRLGHFTLKEYCSEYADLLKSYIQYFLPSAGGWLEETCWETEDYIIFTLYDVGRIFSAEKLPFIYGSIIF